MTRGVRRVVDSLGFRLILPLLATMAAVFAVYGVVSWRATEQRWLTLADGFAHQTSELIERSTQYGMLLNRKEDVHQTLRNIAGTHGVAGVRVYDKQGTIIFSADDSEIGRRVDAKAEACVVCHTDGQPTHVEGSRTRVFRTAEGHGVLGLINPIENQPQCSQAACHAHPAEQTVLGVLDVRMDTTTLDTILSENRTRGFVAMVALALVIGLVSTLFIHRLVRRPIRRLYEGTQRVAAGDLDTRIDIAGPAEVAHLAHAFNRMTEDLKTAREEVTRWSHELERKVVEKTDELARAQRQVLHMEKMASLGQLSATVAHELNNPLCGIVTYARLVDRSLVAYPLPEDVRTELGRYLSLIQKESTRCGGIVTNLLLFARRGGGDLAEAHLRDIVDRCVMLVRHKVEMGGATIAVEGAPQGDVLVCDAGQLQQALLALLVNAIEAMAGMDSGRLTVRLTDLGDALGLDVEDTGSGIAPEVLPHIFEPFFSTKDEEHGVGLGLAVVYGIVQRHGATLEVDSDVGRGTTFHLRLPRRPPALEPPAAREEAAARAT